ncbi:hypothetical protein AMATHDRAFT_156090 [Amanita thiersii Skay4041]|uniref:Threonyl/alanyl tRNA synthetase SAD domain-containing protein n=1 Tax=Amanita thiersii Skay4041 TaxID=703135 RepID=A0A2A9ND44_9AGAR|nr:hypothetical protein AMATHDRAFT_156090 [Amanita thiersii Skay4041]
MAASVILLPPVTHPDYFKVISPTLSVPSDPRVSIPVGLLACQRDPLLKELETVVVSSAISNLQPSSNNGAKKAKKSVIAPPLPQNPLIEVILHDTVIFPEGGGQPTDTGIITTLNDGKQWEVVQAKRHGGHAVQYIEVKEGGIDAAIQVFTPGVKVLVSLGQHGSARRYDHMSMHTSQHLLSALLESRHNLPTLSWSLTNYPDPCYVEVPRGMSYDEIMAIQDEANKLVFEGRKVYVEVQELDEDREKLNPPTLESGRAVGKALPEDYTGGVKRVVIIDGIDRNPCCGTHLPSIHNLQLFLLPHTEALSRSSTTSARLYFLSGPRLIAHLTSTHGLLTKTASILSCGSPLVPERVDQVIDERKRAEKRVADLETELAKTLADVLTNDIISAPEGVLYKKHIHRVDNTSNPLSFLTAVSFATTNALPSPPTSYLCVLSSSPLPQTSSSMTVLLLFGSDDKIVKVAGEALRTKLGVKGGGKGQKWSGKFTGVWRQQEDHLVEDMLKEL